MESVPWIFLSIVGGGLALIFICSMGSIVYKYIDAIVGFKLEIMEEEHKSKIRMLRGMD